jgi:methionine-rich copper-binding protein CopC
MKMARTTELALSVALTLLGLMMYPAAALAHCFPDQTTPSAGSALSSSPPQVILHFDNPFNPAGTAIHVLSGSGAIVSGEGTASSDDRSITVPLKLLGSGQYFVKWRALSKDGDHTLGAYSFTVKGAR